MLLVVKLSGPVFAALGVTIALPVVFQSNLRRDRRDAEVMIPPFFMSR